MKKNQKKDISSPPKSDKSREENPKKSAISEPQNNCHISLGCIFFIFLTLAIGIHLVYLIAQEPSAIPKLNFLHQVFSDVRYAELMQKLEGRHLVIRTGCPECLNEILKYYGVKTKQKMVIRDYTTLSLNRALYMPYFWGVKMAINKAIGEPMPLPKIWVIHTNGHIPQKQIEQLHKLQPKSSIYLILPLDTNLKKIKIEGFKKIDLQDTFNILEMFKLANLPPHYAVTYKNYYNNSVSRIFRQISSKSVSAELQLGEYYIPISEISKKSKRLMRKLCEEGRLKQISHIKGKFLDEMALYGIRIGERTEKYLLGYGVRLTERVAYWEDDRYRLNYMLQTMYNCVRIDIFEPDEEDDDQYESWVDMKCPPCSCNHTVAQSNTEGEDSAIIKQQNEKNIQQQQQNNDEDIDQQSSNNQQTDPNKQLSSQNEEEQGQNEDSDNNDHSQNGEQQL